MCFLAGLVRPIFFLLVLAVKFAVFQHRQPTLTTYLVRDFSQFLVIADFVLKLCSILKGNGIYNEMAMKPTLSRESVCVYKILPKYYVSLIIRARATYIDNLFKKNSKDFSFLASDPLEK